jgi:hypothetical protein
VTATKIPTGADRTLVLLEDQTARPLAALRDEVG